MVKYLQKEVFGNMPNGIKSLRGPVFSGFREFPPWGNLSDTGFSENATARSNLAFATLVAFVKKGSFRMLHLEQISQRRGSGLRNGRDGASKTGAHMRIESR